MEAAKILSWKVPATKILSRLAIIGSLLVLTGCVSYLRIDGPYEGKVVDFNTGQPIEGAVVLGYWSKAHLSPGGAWHTYYDSREVLTDKNGEFSIPGLGVMVMTMVEEMSITIFKAGYNQLPPGSWEGLKGNWPDKEISWQGDKAIFRLKRLTMEERQKKSMELPTLIEDRKLMQKLIKEQNKESRERGWPANTIMPED